MNWCCIWALLCVFMIAVSTEEKDSDDNILTERIFNGKQLQAHERADFFVYVQLIKDETFGEPEEEKSLCGGSMISEKHVLTAAHCVYIDATDTSYYRHYHVRLTFGDFRNELNARHIETTRRFWPHERFVVNSSNMMYDIALVEIRGDRRPQYEVIRLCRSNEKKKFPHTYRVFGMGSVNWNVNQHINPPVVLYADMNEAVHIKKYCGNKEIAPPFDRSIQICMEGIGGQVDVGPGDSGGPAVLQERNKECLYGVAVASYPLDRMTGALFNRASSFSEWIEDTKIVLARLDEDEYEYK